MVELFTLISITIIVAIVPGPDLVVVLRNAVLGCQDTPAEAAYLAERDESGKSPV